MKSSFLMVLVLASLVSVSWAQTTKKKPESKPSAAPTTIKVDPTVEKSSFDKFYDRVGIAAAVIYTGASLQDWNDYTLSEKGQKDWTWAPNLFTSVNFSYNFGGKFKFNIIPRFTTFVQDTDKHGQGDRGLFYIEDTIVAFSGVLYATEDKKFTWWMRPGVRLPTSKFSRSQDITQQNEILSVFTYDFNKTWQLGLLQQFRHWVYEQKYTMYRLRIFHSPFISYAIDDKNKLQFYYEHYIENRKHLMSQDKHHPRFQKQYENAMVGWSHQLTEKLNVTPMLAYMLNGTENTMYPLKNSWVTVWMSYAFK